MRRIHADAIANWAPSGDGYIYINADEDTSTSYGNAHSTHGNWAPPGHTYPVYLYTYPANSAGC